MSDLFAYSCANAASLGQAHGCVRWCGDRETCPASAAPVLQLHANVSPDDAEPPLRSVPTLLRNIADKLEAGEWGSAEECRGALVLRIPGQFPQVFALGASQAAQAYMDLHAGANELMTMSEEAEWR